jgi:hypothetical protein
VGLRHAKKGSIIAEALETIGPQCEYVPYGVLQQTILLLARIFSDEVDISLASEGTAYYDSG